MGLKARRLVGDDVHSSKIKSDQNGIERMLISILLTTYSLIKSDQNGIESSNQK